MGKFKDKNSSIKKKIINTNVKLVKLFFLDKKIKTLINEIY